MQALARTAQQAGLEPKLLNAVEAVNDAQKGHLFALIQRHYDKGEDEGVRGKTFAVWGLAFKPNTDDMREASSRRLLAQLWEGGATVRAYDPEAMHESQRVFGERDDLVFCSNAEEALQGADALVVVTEWKQFRSPDFQKAARAAEGRGGVRRAQPVRAGGCGSGGPGVLRHRPGRSLHV